MHRNMPECLEEHTLQNDYVDAGSKQSMYEWWKECFGRECQHVIDEKKTRSAD